MRKEDAEPLWVQAKQQAKKDLKNLMEKFPDQFENDIVKEAVEATLECLRSPLNNDLKLRAARQILEWFKAKPVAKADITVNKAVDFLASLDDSKDED